MTVGRAEACCNLLYLRDKCEAILGEDQYVVQYILHTS
jgi:hypothetical protein